MMKEFDFRKLNRETIESLAGEYHQHGFVVLTGVDEITNLFPSVLSDATGLPVSEIESMVHPQSAGTLSPSLRKTLSKVSTGPDLARSLLRLMHPLLLRIVGPIVHVSSNFHAQFKGGGIGQIAYSGFHAETEYIEIHGPHLLHQDFPAASIPISPGMMTLWVALNSTSSWKLRLYPGSHQEGVLCGKFLEPTDDRLKHLREPYEIAARRGHAVLFNGMMLHGTGEEGPERRASCDIRFFPFCGFLPSEGHLLVEKPLEFIEEQSRTERASTFQTPLYQDLLFSGKTKFVEERIRQFDEEPYSPLNWIRYLIHLMQGDRERAIPYLRSLVNTKIGTADPDRFVQKFIDHPIYSETLEAVRARIRNSAQ